jgi:hypothetical protein
MWTPHDSLLPASTSGQFSFPSYDVLIYDQHQVHQQGNAADQKSGHRDHERPECNVFSEGMKGYSDCFRKSTR